MEYNIDKAIEILSRTPHVLKTLLHELSEEWTTNNEGPETWSPYDIVGHLIHGERTDWIARMEITLSNGENKKFAPYDRFAQFTESKGKSLSSLLEEFRSLRENNLNVLRSKNINGEMLEKKGIHPSFGEVTLRQLLSTWVVHDLGHIGQIVRVMSKQLKTEVGPWEEYLSVLHK